ncbi:MAG TPA: hypothetical protein VK578_02445 [Edaphobacter sp.]|nr:hypothetical protein [Edaphobacter sp.]
MIHAQEIMPALEDTEYGACTTSDALRLPGHRDLRCLWIDARPET